MAENNYDEFIDKYHPNIYSNKKVEVEFIDRLGFAFSDMLPDSDFPTLNMGKSFNFTIDMLSADIYLNPQRSFLLHTSLRFSFENYVNEYDIPYVNLDEAIVENYGLASGCKKSKMRADYLGIPVGVAYRTRGLRVYGNLVGEMLMKSITKAKFEDQAKIKSKIHGFNQLGASIEAGVSYYCVGFFAKYRFTPSFRSSANVPNQNVFTVGLTLNI